MNILRKTALFLLSKMARLYERIGVWVIPDHFYTPIPELERIRHDATWDSEPREVPGIDMNLGYQERLLFSDFPRYVNEYDFPLKRPDSAKDAGGFYFQNGMFANTDAEVYYCMIRHFKPKQIIEVGAGWSTHISCAAATQNRRDDGTGAEITVIEPYPNRKLLEPLRLHLAGIMEKKVQDVAPEFFNRLGRNDILFIDSSHVVKSGGDVNYLFLEILPRLNAGVIVHIHDIRIPYEVPKLFLLDQSRFFTEQYLLQALLIGNKGFQILCGTYLMTKRHPEKISATFRSSCGGRYVGGSFWIQRRADL
jgi:hypothetical protein